MRVPRFAVGAGAWSLVVCRAWAVHVQVINNTTLVQVLDNSSNGTHGDHFQPRGHQESSSLIQVQVTQQASAAPESDIPAKDEQDDEPAHEGHHEDASLVQLQVVEGPQQIDAQDAAAELEVLEEDWQGIKILPPIEEEGRDMRLMVLGQVVKLPITPMGSVVFVMFVVLSTVISVIFGARTTYFKGNLFTRIVKSAGVGLAAGIVIGCLMNALFCLQARRRKMLENSTYLDLSPDAAVYLRGLQQYLRNNRVQVPLGVAWRQHKATALPAEAYKTRPLLWLHIHKEAGTFACLAAVANGERIVAPSKNCNWEEYDNIWSPTCTMSDCRGEGPGGIGARTTHLPTCQDRKEYFSRWNFTFGSIERELHGSDLCPDFRYGVALREPLHSIESKVFFELKLVKATATELGINVTKSFQISWFKELIDRVYYSNDTSSVPRAGLPGWKLIDNYKVRAILGEQAFNLGPGEVTRAHMEKAVQRLQLFDLVKVLDVEASAKDWDGTSSELMWDHRVRHRLNQRKDVTKPKGLIFDHETKAKLEEINKWDIELFQTFARQAQLGVKVQRTMARRFYSRLMKKMNKKRTVGDRLANDTAADGHRARKLQRKKGKHAARNSTTPQPGHSKIKVDVLLSSDDDVDRESDSNE